MKNKEINPFTASLEIEAIEKLRKHYGNVSTYLVEKHNPVSVYMNDQLIAILEGFSPVGRKMVYYVMKHIGYNKQTIEMTHELFCQRMGEVSIRSYYRAKDELENLILIKKKTRKDTYYVNVNYIFRGRRVDRFPGNVVVVNENPAIKQLRDWQVLPQRETEASEVLTAGDE